MHLTFGVVIVIFWLSVAVFQIRVNVSQTSLHANKFMGSSDEMNGRV